MAYLQIPNLANPLITPWDQLVASGASNIDSGIGPFGYLNLADMVLNFPQGPSDVVQVGSPTQGNKPIVTQTQPWGPTATSGALRGAMAGAPFGWPGVGVGAAVGLLGGKR